MSYSTCENIIEEKPGCVCEAAVPCAGGCRTRLCTAALFLTMYLGCLWRVGGAHAAPLFCGLDTKGMETND